MKTEVKLNGSAGDNGRPKVALNEQWVFGGVLPRLDSETQAAFRADPHFEKLALRNLREFGVRGWREFYSWLGQEAPELTEEKHQIALVAYLRSVTNLLVGLDILDANDFDEAVGSLDLTKLSETSRLELERSDAQVILQNAMYPFMRTATHAATILLLEKLNELVFQNAPLKASLSLALAPLGHRPFPAAKILEFVTEPKLRISEATLRQNAVKARAVAYLRRNIGYNEDYPYNLDVGDALKIAHAYRLTLEDWAECKPDLVNGDRWAGFWAKSVF